MRISSNSFTQPTYYNNLVQRTRLNSYRETSSGDTFTPEREVGFGKSMVPKFVKRMFVPKQMKADAGFHCYLADKMKLYFDFNFGIRNYTIISIGRSMASVTETLGRRRRDAVCLPLSGLSNGLPGNIKNIDVYREFLKSKGLTKEIIEANPDRHYVLVDNAISGESLRNAHKFLSREDLLGNPERLEIRSAKDIFGESLFDKFSLNMAFADFHDYSPVGYLNLYNLEDVFAQGNPVKKSWYKKLFDFAVQDKIDKTDKKQTR